MKLSCTQENLTKGLNIVEKAISKNTTLPILNNILLETDRGRLKLSATNLEIGINYWLGAQITSNGSITIPARLLLNFVNSLPKQKINLSIRSNNLIVKGEISKASIKGLSSKNFPIIPQIKSKPLISLPIPALNRALSQSASAVAVSQTRPEMSGVFVNFQEREIKIAATDSYRLAEKIIRPKNKISKSVAVIVPSRTIYELVRIFGEQEGEVQIILGENQILFKFGNIQLISRLVEGQYPDYEQIIPSKFKIRALLLTSEIQNAIKTASFFAGRTDEVKLKFKKPKRGGAKLEVQAESDDKGSNVSQLKTKLKGKGAEIVFNYHYLLDGLQNILTDFVEIAINDNKSPAILKPFTEPNKRPKDKDYLYLIMPIKD